MLPLPRLPLPPNTISTDIPPLQLCLITIQSDLLGDLAPQFWPSFECNLIGRLLSLFPASLFLPTRYRLICLRFSFAGCPHAAVLLMDSTPLLRRSFHHIIECTYTLSSPPPSPPPPYNYCYAGVSSLLGNIQPDFTS